MTKVDEGSFLLNEAKSSPDAPRNNRVRTALYASAVFSAFLVGAIMVPSPFQRATESKMDSSVTYKTFDSTISSDGWYIYKVLFRFYDFFFKF
jgi:hypothetical protein